MIRMLNERIITSQEKLRGGNLTTAFSEFLTEEEVCGEGRLFGYVTLPPKGSIGFHQHVGELEIYVVTKGTATVTENDRSEHRLNVGDTMLCKPGDSHAVRNDGDSDMEFLAVILYVK